MSKIILGMLAIGAFFLALAFGAYPFLDLFHGEGLSILLNLRLPLTFSITLSGFALGVSGVLLQGLFRNPLADPALLGFSAGAGFFVIVFLEVLSLLGLSLAVFNIWLPVIAFLGALFSMGVLFCITRFLDSKQALILLLCGIGFSVFLAALASLILIQLSNQGLHLILWWGLGGASLIDKHLLGMAFFLLILVCFGLKSQTKALDVLVLGEEAAESLGVSLKALRVRCLCSVAVLVGVSVALTGPIGFIGLMVPHIARIFFGFKHQALLWTSGLLGSSVLLISHALAVCCFSPLELPLGVATALLGVPCFFYLLLARELKC